MALLYLIKYVSSRLARSIYPIFAERASADFAQIYIAKNQNDRMKICYHTKCCLQYWSLFSTYWGIDICIILVIRIWSDYGRTEWLIATINWHDIIALWMLIEWYIMMVMEYKPYWNAYPFLKFYHILTVDHCISNSPVFNYQYQSIAYNIFNQKPSYLIIHICYIPNWIFVFATFILNNLVQVCINNYTGCSFPDLSEAQSLRVSSVSYKI